MAPNIGVIVAIMPRSYSHFLTSVMRAVTRKLEEKGPETSLIEFPIGPPAPCENWRDSIFS